jgi:hypothetical protein
MKKKIIPLGLMILLFIFSLGCTQSYISDEQIGKTFVTFDGGKVTSGDIENFKKYRQDNLSDKQALEMIIERELLYKEAQAQGMTATLEDARVESDKVKSTFDQYGTEQDKKVIQDTTKELKISEKEYWNNYHPKGLLKTLSIGKVSKSIKDKIYSDIMKKHSNLGQAKIEREFKESYEKVINDLKSKYNLQYVSS